MHVRPPAPDFVGRRAELAVFEGALADARRGLPSVVLVSGDAGIGKTTIVSESAARAGVGLYIGRSTHIGGDAIPLAPLADLLRQVRRSNPDLLSETPALAVLHDWSVPRSAVPALDGSPHGGLFVAVLELFNHLAADAAVVVGFEDLHWADTVTWDLFDYLARNLIDEQVVLVGTYRANEVAVRPHQRGRLAELTRLPATHRMHLDGLDRADVAQRVAALLGTPAPSALVEQVVARGRGNPFFTGELVAAHLSGETIPIVLSDLISTEIADLDDRARHVLGAIAAIGRETSHDLLTSIVALPDLEVEAALRTVVDARLIVVDNEAYRFRHPLFGEVVYADLLPPQRARLHRSIAATLAQQPADALRRADRAGELAFHLDRAGDVEGPSPRCSPQPMPPRPSHQAPPWVTSSERSNSGTWPETARRRPTAATACGRPPTSPCPLRARHEASSWRALRSPSGPLHSVSPGATNGSAPFASVYLCVVLIDAGHYQSASDTALDAVTEGRLAGLDHRFGCYLDSLAAEALTRLGRWPEAVAILTRRTVGDTPLVALLRLSRAEAMLAARRGETQQAISQLAEADALPVEGWHQTVRSATTADVHLSLGNWGVAAAAAEQGWSATGTTSALWAARFAMFGVIAEVERTLDQRAHRETVDLAGTVVRLQQRVEAARSLAELVPGGPQRDTAAHLAHAAASVTRLTVSDADAWGEAVVRWSELGDLWAMAVALVREAEAAALAGAADRAASSLRQAHELATHLGAVPLLAEIDAVSSRTRISVEAPLRITLDETSAERLGLTPREAEVLTVVAAGRTNRQIGEELYVSDKTASVHVSNILRKLGVSSRVDAAAVAQRLGMT